MVFQGIFNQCSHFISNLKESGSAFVDLTVEVEFKLLIRIITEGCSHYPKNLKNQDQYLIDSIMPSYSYDELVDEACYKLYCYCLN